jgi:hypothetical protein
MTDNASEPQQQEQPIIDEQSTIVAGPGRYYRNTRYIMFIVLMVFGILSIRDGYFKYPRENEQAIENARAEARSRGQDPDKVVDPKQVVVPHPGLDIPFNRVIGLVLPPLALLFVIRALHNSRGEYRLEGHTLHVPGHPAVPFDNINSIDRARWDKKGIAFIHYDLGDGRQGKIRLDDYHYDRPPTDAIFERIEKYVNPPDELEEKESD